MIKQFGVEAKYTGRHGFTDAEKYAREECYSKIGGMLKEMVPGQEYRVTYENIVELPTQDNFWMGRVGFRVRVEGTEFFEK